MTKLNPTKWAGKTEAQRWFQSRIDIEEDFVYGAFDQMILFRHCGGELPFGSFLEGIVLDDPELETDERVDFFSAAHGALSLAMTDAGIEVPIERRACKATCTCTDEYSADINTAEKMFLPEI